MTGGTPTWLASFIDPPLPFQQEIIAQIEAEQEMVNGNKKLMGTLTKTSRGLLIPP
jgi:hypothetical protein